ncbi:YicC/YloC family endoribonuclease [Quatrionicoccus australiensis]|uniref:YicC/YloC family endoribonuclease n=1 Tax=Quatrionicoccus australiensis TaxID=138118 RepID=UPI001CF8EB68|nr:YicC/YloC family endoribonuclease [Quatrionicoccus australiensis]MCB4359722.1 YicC family protein [Quatrionicoccus australiensis]UCV14821.1 YicC family protein [Quatrionicoccus australiensis]
MISSMTGYAVKTRDIERGTLQLELKSVNSRYLDFHFRISEDLRALEMPLRELLASRLARGKIECRLSFNASAARADQLELNADLLGSLTVLNARVREAMPEARPLSVNDVLRWPGMFGDQSIDFATFNAPVLALAREVLDEFTASRGREGEKLAAMIVDRVNAMRDIVRNVAPRIPEAQALFADKLRQRLQEALGNASDDRIMQEVAVFATRIDVAEELSRLGTHLDEVERVLRQGGASGKRLDFLMQELNREANTLGSKSAITEVSQASVDLKLLIEQMREQIQNLE